MQDGYLSPFDLVFCKAQQRASDQGRRHNRHTRISPERQCRHAPIIMRLRDHMDGCDTEEAKF
jgi:hypothetical protein